MPAGAIADDDELKIGGIVVVAQMRDGIAFLLGDERFAAATDAGQNDRGAGADERVFLLVAHVHVFDDDGRAEADLVARQRRRIDNLGLGELRFD